MAFLDYLKEIEKTQVFPSDEEIEKVSESADEAFWKIVVEAFKDKLESKEFIQSKELANFKEQQKYAIKEWLKSNWPEPDDSNKSKPKVKEFKGGVTSFEPPASNLPASGEARI